MKGKQITQRKLLRCDFGVVVLLMSGPLMWKLTACLCESSCGLLLVCPNGKFSLLDPNPNPNPFCFLFFCDCHLSAFGLPKLKNLTHGTLMGFTPGLKSIPPPSPSPFSFPPQCFYGYQCPVPAHLLFNPCLNASIYKYNSTVNVSDSTVILRTSGINKSVLLNMRIWKRIILSFSNSFILIKFSNKEAILKTVIILPYCGSTVVRLEDLAQLVLLLYILLIWHVIMQ